MAETHRAFLCAPPSRLRSSPLTGSAQVRERSLVSEGHICTLTSRLRKDSITNAHLSFRDPIPLPPQLNTVLILGLIFSLYDLTSAKGALSF